MERLNSDQLDLKQVFYAVKDLEKRLAKLEDTTSKKDDDLQEQIDKLKADLA